MMSDTDSEQQTLIVHNRAHHRDGNSGDSVASETHNYPHKNPIILCDSDFQ